MNPEDIGDLDRAQSTSRARAKAFVAAIDSALNVRDDRIAAQLAMENSSGRVKLGKVYQLVAEVATVAEPFIACAKGCSACCKMNVSITSLEAERLAKISGRTIVQVINPVKHVQDKFSGVPCPFLVDDVCSVYDARPYACRAHMSFDISSYWCQPERAYVDGMGMAMLGGVQEAYMAIALNTPLGGFADIRDFFPSV